MTWGLVAVAGASLVGGVMSGNAASDAANTQAESGQRALDFQRQVYNTQLGLQQPYNQAGVAASNRLSWLMGLSPTGYNSPNNYGMSTGTGTATGDRGSFFGGSGGGTNATPPAGFYQQDNGIWVNSQGQTWSPPAADPNAQGGQGGNPSDPIASAYQQFLGRAPDAQGQQFYSNELKSGMTPEQISAQIQASPEAKSGGYGSLTRPFSLQDFQLDPGIQFATQQGNLALQNSQSAKNGVLSGAALKDLIGFNSGMAAQGYQSAYDRYVNNQNMTYSRLMGITGVGQAAASNASSNAGAMAGTVGNTLTGIGNAQASGIVGSANAFSGAASGAGNAMFLNGILNRNSGSSNFSSSPMSDLLYSNNSLGD